MKLVEYLAINCFPHSYDLAGKQDTVLEYLTEQLKQYDCKLYVQDYATPEGYEFKNLIAEFGAGEANEDATPLLVVGAHYDYVSKVQDGYSGPASSKTHTLGADDNASGVAKSHGF